MPAKKMVYSGSVGNPYHGKTAPNTRRKLNTKKGKK